MAKKSNLTVKLRPSIKKNPSTDISYLAAKMLIQGASYAWHRLMNAISDANGKHMTHWAALVLR